MEPAIIIPEEATKWDIRHKVWDFIETEDLATFPRPVHHRIPNFKGSQGACGKITGLDFFSKCSEVKADPDKPLEGARLAALQAGKTLLVPTPRLRTGLFNRIVPPPRASMEDLRVCSTSRGVREFSVPVGLDAGVHVDLIVVGSVAVSENGHRIGKGEGFADMEYAMMVSMGALDQSTVVVTVVHDCQVTDIPEGLMESHDLTVDYILTPTRVIKTECKIPKPQGIIWAKLDTEMLEKIPILKKLRASEQKSGKDVTLKTTKQLHNPEPEPEEPGPDSEPERRRRVRLSPPGSGLEPAVSREAPVNTLYLGGFPAGLRASELKAFLRERDAAPVRLTWQGAQRRAFLRYPDQRATDRALVALRGLRVSGHPLRVEPAESRRTFRGAGASQDFPKTILKQQQQLRLQHLQQPASSSSSSSAASQTRGWRKNPEKVTEG